VDDSTGQKLPAFLGRYHDRGGDEGDAAHREDGELSTPASLRPCADQNASRKADIDQS
jgi:hypothetical protein